MREIDPNDLTVEDLVAMGIDAMIATCGDCGNTWRAPTGFLPNQTSTKSIKALMICPSCSSRDIDVRPAWPDRPPIPN